jgi:hypothetical protein
MSDDIAATPATPRPPDSTPSAPGNRIRPRLVIALAVASLLVLGVAGLVATALFGDDGDDPTGSGLRPTVNVDEPATAPPATGEPSDSTAEAAPESTEAADDSGAPATTEPGDTAGPDTAGPDASGPEGSGPETSAGAAGGDDDFSDEPAIETVPAVNDLEQPDASDLPDPGDEPVILPPQVTTPAPPSTYAEVPFDDVGPAAIDVLDGWSESARDGDHVAFDNGDEVVELFLISGVPTADAALEHFYDDVRPDLEELTRSDITRLGAPSGRFVSVAGSEYTATSAGQQGTSTMSGSIVAAVRSDGTAVVLTTSRSGSSSASELAADGELLTAIVAHL